MKRALFLLMGLFFVSMNARAALDRAATEQVSVELIPALGAVSPGATLWLGLRQKIIPHWHTYWINPGDSGLPTRIEWQLPVGATAGPIHWPVPSRFSAGPIANYGYADEVTLLSPLTVPASAQVGASFPVRARVSWLVCEELCIPQTVDLALNLPIVAAGPAAAINPQIEAALAALPQQAAWPSRVERSGDKLVLRLVGAAAELRDARDIIFFADQWGWIEHAAAQSHRSDGADAVIELTPGEKKLDAGAVLSGVLAVVSGSDTSPVRTGYLLGGSTASGPVTSAATEQSAPNTETMAQGEVAQDERVDAGAGLALLPAVLLAFLGGIILNLMPCVFPVLSIKALSLLKHSAYTPVQTRLQGVAYTGGVLASFGLLALILVALKAGGAQIGWGFQYQSPTFVLLVAYLMFAVGLNLSGVFEFGTSITGVGSGLAQRPGYTGSFFTGVLAAIVATPCTAPFMGAAVGYALARPALQMLTVLLSLGFGLALPYLLLTLLPALRAYLPRPGVWMEHLKQALAFPMYAAAAWLVWVLAQQAGTTAIVFALGGMVAIAFAGWLYQRTRQGGSTWRRAGTGIAIVAVVLAIAGGYSGVSSGAPVNTAASRTESTKNWEPYSAQRLQALRAAGKPVFINFTAAWCISCLVNDRVALQQASVVAAFHSQNIAYLKGDWTNQDREISAKLAEFGRSGVPLYLYFPAGAKSAPQVLPQLLTTEIVLAAIAPPVGAASTTDFSGGRQPHGGIL